jgi:hypothetical protein
MINDSSHEKSKSLISIDGPAYRLVAGTGSISAFWNFTNRGMSTVLSSMHLLEFCQLAKVHRPFANIPLHFRYWGKSQLAKFPLAG